VGNLSIIVIQFANKELKIANYAFEIHVRNYIKKAFFYVLTLRYMCYFEMSSQKFNLKSKT
jgi:hypothetical protein